MDISIFGRDGLRHLAAVQRANQGQAFGIGGEFVNGTPADQRRVLGRDDVRQQFEGTRCTDAVTLTEEAQELAERPDRP